MDRRGNEEAQAGMRFFLPRSPYEGGHQKDKGLWRCVCNSPNLSCPRVSLPSFDRARPTAGRLIPVCPHFHPIQRSFAPRSSFSVISSPGSTPSSAHSSSPNWRRRSDLLDIYTLALLAMRDQPPLVRSIPFYFKYRAWFWRYLHIFALHSLILRPISSSSLFAPATSSRSGVEQTEDKPTEMVGHESDVAAWNP
jgi:hypothetical protein